MATQLTVERIVTSPAWQLALKQTELAIVVMVEVVAATDLPVKHLVLPSLHRDMHGVMDEHKESGWLAAGLCEDAGVIL
jgi:hypothetical protein